MSDATLLRVAAQLCQATARGVPPADDIALTDPALRAGVLAVGRVNRCLPLLAPPLEARGLSPQEARELSDISAAAWASHQLTVATLGPVLRQAHQDGITILVYKGAAQGQRFYREPWRRQMQDIDLLVAPSAVAPLGALLHAAGYTMLGTPGRSRSVQLSHERTFVHRDAGVRMVDVHTHPAPPSRYAFAYDQLEDNSQVAELYDAPVRFLRLEDELIIAAVNQAYDHFRGSLLRAVDGALIAATERVDWNQVLDGAARAGARTAAWITFNWMTAIAGASIPENVIAALAPTGGRRLWLSALLQPQGRAVPRLRLPRRVEQGLLTFPLMDDPGRFLGYVGRHGARRWVDLWRAVRGIGD